MPTHLDHFSSRTLQSITSIFFLSMRSADGLCDAEQLVELYSCQGSHYQQWPKIPPTNVLWTRCMILCFGEERECHLRVILSCPLSSLVPHFFSWYDWYSFINLCRKTGNVKNIVWWGNKRTNHLVDLSNCHKAGRLHLWLVLVEQLCQT